LVGKRAKQRIIGFTPIDMRICVLRMEAKFYNISIINAHVSTEDKEDDEKEIFYEALGRAYDNCPKNDLKIIIGDMNAKIGKEQIYRKYTGRHSAHEETNENGNRLINLAASQNMVLGSTRFERKNIYKYTWESPDWETQNQIDHILLDSKHINNLVDVRTYRGVNIDSDHYLLGSKVRVRISNIRKSKGPRLNKFNLGSLKSETGLKTFREDMHNRLNKVNITGLTVNGRWEQCRKVFIAPSEEILGMKEVKRNEGWYNKECKDATNKKNEAYKRMTQRCITRASVEKYRQLRREEKRIHRYYKRQFENNLVEEIEYFRLQNESRKLYQCVHHIGQAFIPRSNMCKDTNVTILTNREQVLGRWVEHFKTLLEGENVEEAQDEELDK
jgi:hypothetical protein